MRSEASLARDVDDASDRSGKAGAASGREALAPTTRRGFLGRSAAAGAGLALSGAGAAGAANIGVLPSLYSGWNARNFSEIRKNENAHVQLIIETILRLGGTPRPEPRYTNLIRSANAQAFVHMSAAFENTGVGAYQGAAPYILNKAALLPTAAAINLVESYHAGYLNTLINSPIVPGGSVLSMPLTQQKIVAHVEPYIAGLNGGPAPGFSTTMFSPENDIAILNFALLLEYLERDFYNLNVPRVFPGT